MFSHANGSDNWHKAESGDVAKMQAWWRPVALLTAVVVVLILARAVGLDERLSEIRHWINGLGAWGPLVFVLLYAAAVVAALPGSALTVVAGALFGSVLGVIVVSLASTLGASLAFLLARYLARDATARWLAQSEKFRRLDQLTEERGAIIVALTRLVPLFPFNLLNYGFGLTRVPFRTYVFWSWLCMLPGTVLYVVGADTVTKGLVEGELPWGLIVVLLSAALLVAILVRYARRQLSERMETKMLRAELTAPVNSALQVAPMDEHNTTLVTNVHPPDWVNPEPAPRYNLVVIGAGTAGLVTAAGAAGLGARVALVERSLLGGDCLNVGCVPSKAVIRSSRAYADVRDAHLFGVRVPHGTEVDFPAVMERMRRIRARISHHDSAWRFQELGVDVFLGEARFTSRDTVEVGRQTLRFKKAVIATGARAVEPPIEGLAEAGYLTNETVFSLTERPEHLAVIGGGPIGCELAQAFRRLGSQVTLIEMAPQLLIREDADAAEILTCALRRDGVDIRLGTKVTRVTLLGGKKLIHLENNGSTDLLAVDEILVGVGRAPNVEGLSLDIVGVEYDRRNGIIVNDRLQTTNPRIYAAGDVCMRYKFTHAADAAARIVIQNALFLGRKKLSAITIPWCTYTDPEVAHVGLSEREAQERGIPINTFMIALGNVDRALADGEEEGFVKILVKKRTDKILGATIVARHAGEMINEITLAMVERIGLGRLASVIHPYPTQAEAIKKAADAYQRTRLTPGVKKMLGHWLAWTR